MRAKKIVQFFAWVYNDKLGVAKQKGGADSLRNRVVK